MIGEEGSVDMASTQKRTIGECLQMSSGGGADGLDEIHKCFQVKENTDFQIDCPRR